MVVEFQRKVQIKNRCHEVANIILISKSSLDLGFSFYADMQCTSKNFSEQTDYIIETCNKTYAN